MKQGFPKKQQGFCLLGLADMTLDKPLNLTEPQVCLPGCCEDMRIRGASPFSWPCELHTPSPCPGHLLQGPRRCAEVQGGCAFLRQHVGLGARGQQQPHTVRLGLGTCLVQGCPAPDPGIQLSSLPDEVAGTVSITSGRSDSEGHRLLGLGGQHPEPCGEPTAIGAVNS